MKLKFSFLPIPEELMKSRALSFGAKFLFGIIAKANKEVVRWSVRYLSERMNCCDRETKRRIKELKENNFVTTRRRYGRVNEYIVNFELVQIVQTGEKEYISKEKRKKLKEELLKKQKGKCFYCKRKFYLKDTANTLKESLRWPELDHIIPKSKGGTDFKDNFVLACKECNQKKGTNQSPYRDNNSPQDRDNNSHLNSKELSLKKINKEGLKRFKKIKSPLLKNKWPEFR